MSQDFPTVGGVNDMALGRVIGRSILSPLVRRVIYNSDMWDMWLDVQLYYLMGGLGSGFSGPQLSSESIATDGT